MVKLFLDPGHGGSDPGAVANGLREKDLTLDISLRIRDILLRDYQGVEVRMSRTTDTTVSLSERTNAANTWGANFFLSIHINAFNGSAHGYEDYIHSNLSDSSQTAQYRNIIHQEVTRVNELHNRGKKKANFHVLRETNMPAVLTENGFIDHSGDAQKLRDSNWLQRVAQGHVNGIAQAFNLQRKSSSTLHRVIVDGIQVGAFREEANILNAVQQHLSTANRIVVEKV